MEETDFGWALAKLRDGYALRRRAWSAEPSGHCPYIVLYVSDGGQWSSMPGEPIELVVGKDRDFVSEFLLDDVMAYDWEIVSDAAEPVSAHRR